MFFRILSAIFFILSFFSFFLIHANANPNVSSNSNNLFFVCNKIVSDLNNIVPIQGKKIQVNENNLWERDTKFNLPFSKVLRDGIAAAIAKQGAIVTVQEVGIEPLRIIGNYAKQGDSLIITLRIRLMGESASEDRAVSASSIKFSHLESSWFKPKFDRVAKTMVRLLEENYSGCRTMKVTVEPIKPGLPGQAPLLLGREFNSFIKMAIATSPVFGASSVDQADVTAFLRGTYTIIDDYLDLKLNIVTAHDQIMTSANHGISLVQIPCSLMKVMADQTINVCTVFFLKKGTAIEVDSFVVDGLKDYVNESLSDHGLVPGACSPADKSDVRVEINLQARKKEKGSGYSLLTGKVQFRVVGKNGKKIGVISKNLKQLFKNDFEGALGKSLQTLYKKKQVGKKLAKMILGRI